MNSSSFSSASTANEEEANLEAPPKLSSSSADDSADFNNNKTQSENFAFESLNDDESTNPGMSEKFNECELNEKRKEAATVVVVDNSVALSIENLEEIRVKAASMSLPLLTALCSDKTLLRNLNHATSSSSKSRQQV